MVAVNEKGSDVPRGDVGQGGIAAEEGLEFAESVVVVGQGAGRESPGPGGKEVAFNGLGEADLVAIHGSSGCGAPGLIMPLWW